jgi:hypothetical protein
MACPSIEKRFEESTLAFFGKVVNIEYLETDTRRNEPRIKVSFDVKKQWKGNTEETTLETVRNRYTCDGYAFRKNFDYLVLVKKHNKNFKIDVCSALPKTANDFIIINKLFMKDENTETSAKKSDITSPSKAQHCID